MPTSSPKTFTRFPLLAPELRLKIWQFACSPRTVSVRYDLEQDRCLSPSSPPNVLQACHESRDEVLRTYRLSFGTRSHPARIYFNPYRDTLYLPRHRQMGYDETLRGFRSFLAQGEIAMLDELRKIAIDHVDVEIKRPWESYNKASLLRGFPMLQQVVLVMCSGRRPSVGLDDEFEFVEPKDDPEFLLRIWVDFRQCFVKEERMLEEFCKAVGEEYVQVSLPMVRLKSKALMKI